MTNRRVFRPLDLVKLSQTAQPSRYNTGWLIRASDVHALLVSNTWHLRPRPNTVN